MGAKKTGIIIAVVSVLAFVGIVAMVGVGYSNTEIELRTQAGAQEKANEVIYTKVWTVISQQAQVTDKYATDFKEIYSGLMSGRYDADKGSNPAFKMIREHNPSFSVEMYKGVSDSIAGLRAEFARVQNRLVDVKREHDVLRKTFPSSLFVGGREELDIKIITSTKTKETFKQGLEDDVSVF